MAVLLRGFNYQGWLNLQTPPPSLCLDERSSDERLVTTMSILRPKFLILTTLGTKTIVLISEVSLFQGENNMYLYKVGTHSSVLINQMSLFQRCPLRDLPLYTVVCTVSYTSLHIGTESAIFMRI